jgi:hypothetical protein
LRRAPTDEDDADEDDELDVAAVTSEFDLAAMVTSPETTHRHRLIQELCVLNMVSGCNSKASYGQSTATV